MKESQRQINNTCIPLGLENKQIDQRIHSQLK